MPSRHADGMILLILRWVQAGELASSRGLCCKHNGNVNEEAHSGFVEL